MTAALMVTARMPVTAVSVLIDDKTRLFLLPQLKGRIARSGFSRNGVKSGQ